MKNRAKKGNHEIRITLKLAYNGDSVHKYNIQKSKLNLNKKQFRNVLHVFYGLDSKMLSSIVDMADMSTTQLSRLMEMTSDYKIRVFAVIDQITNAFVIDF